VLEVREAIYAFSRKRINGPDVCEQLASLASPDMFPQLDVCTASMAYFPSLAALKIPTILWLTAPAAREAEVESSFCTV
jgi:hypothetical protein